MSESKSTPGPWKQVVYDDWLHIGGDEMVYVQYDPMDEPYNYAVENAVCVVENVENMTDADYANAALLAASPDLLEALELVMPWASKAVADHYNQKAGERALDVAHAAIEKATAIN